MRLLAVLGVATFLLAGCGSLLESSDCGTLEPVHYAAGSPPTIEATSTPDGWEWYAESGSACSKQHVNASASATAIAPGPGCSAITGLEARLQPSGAFGYGPYPGTSSDLGDGRTYWTAQVQGAGLAQAANEGESTSFSVAARVLYPKTGDEVADAACVDAMLQELKIDFVYKQP